MVDKKLGSNGMPSAESAPLLTNQQHGRGEDNSYRSRRDVPPTHPSRETCAARGEGVSGRNRADTDNPVSPVYANSRLSGMPMKSYSVTADGQVSYLTPLQMGRHELYEFIPFTAVFGLQKKEKNMSRAFASYAADLDTMEADQLAVANTNKHMSDLELQKHRSHASLLLLDELEHDTATVTIPLIFAVLVATMTQFLVGYNIGVMNAPASVVFVGHTTVSWSLAVAAFAVGGPCGANLSGPLADNRGRRGALLISTWTFLFGGLVQTFALDIFSLIVARLIVGFAAGVASVLVPIYLGELAPPTLRGTLGTLTQFALVIGILVSDLLAFPLATESSWRFLFSVTSIVAILQLFCAPFLLESPRWLLNRDPDSRKARYIIKKLRGLRYDHEVETECNHFVSASIVQKCETLQGSPSRGPLSEMFLDKKVKLLVVCCFSLQMAQQLCGINAVFYYSTIFFDGVIDNPLVGTTVVGAVNVAATYVALLLMESCGRRTLILWSSGGMFVCCVVLVLALLGYFHRMVALGAVNLYVAFFEIGLGPVPWLIVAEMFDAKYVATAMSASCQVNWICNFIVGIVFPYMNEYLGAYSFVPFSVVLLVTFVFVFFYLPETQGTTPDELQAELVRKNSTTVYRNINIESAHHNPIDMEWRHAMDLLRREEAIAMQSGTYNYGFEPTDDTENITTSEQQVSASDWQSSVSGGR